jgi:steroid delta-isomerase-like uncharacterized protein
MTPESLQRSRERIVLAHIDAEQRGDWVGALETFHHPRYEITPTGEVFDGEEEVLGFYRESASAFPEISFQTRALYSAETAVIHEAVMTAQHRGAWRGLPGTGRMVQYSMLNVFLFEEDRLVGERMYFDLLTLLRQVGVARDPLSLAGRVGMVLSHPLSIGTAFVRQALRGSAPRGTG